MAATESLLSKVNVFPSLSSFNENSDAVDSNSLNLIKAGAVLVESWHDNSSWYNKWSNGYIEQGGWLTTAAGTHTVTFPCEFATTSLSVGCVPYDVDGKRHAAVTGTPTQISASFISGEGANGAQSYKKIWWAMGY